MRESSTDGWKARRLRSAATEKARVPAFVFTRGCKEGYYWLSVAVWNFLLELALNLDMLVV